MDTKKKGIIIIAIAIILLIVITIGSSYKCITTTRKLNSIQSQQDCTEHEKTIARLQSEVNQLRDIVEATESNNDTTVCDKAMFFLESFYSPDQATKIKPLMTENAYKELYGSTTVQQYQTSSAYKVSFSNVSTYYSKISDIEADVLILADFNVDSSSGVTSAPFIFHINMIYENGNWLVQDILQNSTIQFNN